MQQKLTIYTHLNTFFHRQQWNMELRSLDLPKKWLLVLYRGHMLTLISNIYLKMILHYTWSAKKQTTVFVWKYTVTWIQLCGFASMWVSLCALQNSANHHTSTFIKSLGYLSPGLYYSHIPVLSNLRRCSSPGVFRTVRLAGKLLSHLFIASKQTC